jgi:lysophospholipase L1-like esterase
MIAVMSNLFRGRRRRRSVRPVVVVLAATLVIAGCSDGSQATPAAAPLSEGARADGKPVPVAIIGDSYTAGTDVGGLGDTNWTKILARNAEAARLPLQLRVSGKSSSGYVTKGGQGTTFPGEARRIVTAVDRVVIVFGSRNDAYADVTAAAETTFRVIERKAPNATVIAIAPPPTSSDAPPYLRKLGSEIQVAAKRKNVTFVNTIKDGWFSGRRDLMGADGWHPNDAGHRYMADKITPVVLAALRR